MIENWSIEAVERGYVGEYTSHILDSQEVPHIMYFDYTRGNLKHARLRAEGWNIEDVDDEGTVGQYLSITKDDKEHFYVSYRDQGKNRLKMAVFDGNRWTCEVVDEEPFASVDTSIAVDQMGRIYISYYNFSKGYLKLATKDVDQWKIEIVDDGQEISNATGGFSSLQLDSDGRVHISYIDSVNGLLKYALREDRGWILETADDSEFVGNFTCLALDKEGNAFISYTVDKRPNKPDLWLAKRLGGQWVNELVDTDEVVGNYNSMVVDNDSNIYLSYSAMTNLKLATHSNGAWSFEQIDPNGTVTYTSLSLDRRGMPHIAYHDKERGVMYAHKIRSV